MAFISQSHTQKIPFFGAGFGFSLVISGSVKHGSRILW